MGCTMSKEDNPNKVNIKRFSMLEHLSREFIKIISDEAFTRSETLTKLEADRKRQAENDINERISLDEETGTVTASYEYLEAKLENLGNNKNGALQRAIKNYAKIQQKENVVEAVDA